MATKIIEQLKSVPGLKIECPNCSGVFSVKRAKLFNMYGDYPLAARKRMAKRTAQVVSLTGDIQERISILRKDQTRKPQQITLGTESSNFGKGIEQIAPAFSTFPYSPAECRIVLMPVDYIMFEGLSNYGRIEAIRFVELKTGSGRLLKRQKQIRDCIKQGTSLTR